MLCIIVYFQNKQDQIYICIINKNTTKTFILGNFELEYYKNFNRIQKKNDA